MSQAVNRGRVLKLLGIVAVLLMLWGALATVFDGGEQAPVASLSGSEGSKAAPDFELEDINGGAVRLSKFKDDRPVLLYFWATWCPYCISIKPDVARLREKIGAKEMEILAINVGGGDTLEKLKRYQEGHPVPWPVLYDGNGKVARSFQVQGIPMFVLVDKAGKVVYRGNNLPANPLEYLR